eukprot:5004869-Alexandrium_andersonii.AAC.1
MFNVVGVDAGHLAVAATAGLYAMSICIVGWSYWLGKRAAAGSRLPRRAQQRHGRRLKECGVF